MILKSREELCETVHMEIDRLTRRRDKPGHEIPKNGIYFWYEEGEIRVSGGERITRVGTHKQPNRLHERIKEHYGLNREGSVFRKHLGGALMRRNRELESEIEEWYKARRSPRFKDSKFLKYEAYVTNEAKRGAYRALKVNDADTRLKLEERLIALFSKCNHCLPSKEWLGNHAYREEIRSSGLWNVQHTNSFNKFIQSDLPQLIELVDGTLK